MNKDYFFGSVIIGVALVLMGWFVGKGLEKVGAKPRIVNVRGLAEKEVYANKVTWPLRYGFKDDDINVLYAKIKKANQTVTDYLEKNGIKADEINIKYPEINDRSNDPYLDNKQKQERYSAYCTITVTSNNVKNVQKLINNQGDLISLGIVPSTDDYAISFEYTDLNKIKPAMIEEATKNARAAAEKFAKDSDSKLGNIQEASQGLFSIEDRDNNTPYIKNVRVVTSVSYFLE